MKIGIIGFGAAAIGFLKVLAGSSHELHIFEKAKDIYSSSLSGIRADGKLFISKGMGGDLELDEELQKEVVDFYLNNSDSGLTPEKGFSFKDRDYYEQFYNAGFEPILSEFFHIGTDGLESVLKNIYDRFANEPNVKFHFDSEVQSIKIADKSVVKTEKDEYEFNKVIVSVGRSGHGLVKNIISHLPELVLDNTMVDLGIRFELPNHVVTKLNEEMYEFKVKYKADTGYYVRTFCNNPSGYVVPEKYYDFVAVNGHAKVYEKSANTNFAVLVTHKFTQPFNEPISYGSYIAKLSNILAGGQKVILQTFGDFKKCRRTKRLYRVQPTMDSEHYIMGDLNLVLPRKTTKSILEFLEKLDEIVPGITYSDNLMYGTEVKFYSNKLNNDKFDCLSFIGDCSGWTRSITYATAHGILEAQKILS